MTLERNQRPDVLVIITDCGRAADFPGGKDPVATLPNLEALYRRSASFPRAISPAPWTVPSHGSLLTGLEPWEHGLHGKGHHKLPAHVNTLAGRLGQVGYRTLSLSANPFISPVTDLSSGFQSAAWGRWTETWLRFRPGAEAPQSFNLGPRSAYLPIQAVDSGLHGLFLAAEREMLRRPLAWQIGSRTLRAIRRPKFDEIGEAPWIPKILEGWLKPIAHHEPVFCFVNLLDAHEPYLADLVLRSNGSNGGSWLGCARVPQDHVALLQGTWILSDSDRARLRELYRASLRSIDRRVGEILQVWQGSGRWDDTVVVFASDHGQALGEHGEVFHTTSVHEALLRIPLWVRFPRDRLGGAVGRGWASLIDVAPTIFQETGLASTEALPGLPLPGLLTQERPGPVFAIGDGLVEDRTLSMPEPIRKRFDLTYAVGYEGNLKLIHDIDRKSWSLYDVEEDSFETRNLATDPNRIPRRLRGQVETVAQRFRGSSAAEGPLEERLRGWGYA